MNQNPRDIPLRTRLRAILGQRCPRCLQGKAFAGFVRMHKRCPVCELQFGREAGYFVAAMYFSYAISIVVLVLISAILYWGFGDRWSTTQLVSAVVGLFLLCVPAIFRYSRILWMHSDWLIDPNPVDRHGGR